MSTEGQSRLRSDGPAESGHYAIAIAILPPPDVSECAVALSAALPAAESQGLQLGPECLPHVTLMQQFVSRDALDELISDVDRVLRDQEPLPLRVTGGAKGSNSVWMAVERTTALVRLHEQLLEANTVFDVVDGDAAGFFAADARDRDVRWVREFRRESSFASFTPHITLGHASEPPRVDAFDFVATTIAVCHLGRCCSCRRIIRAWEL
jgi:2'-5' RNA ligase